MKKNILVILGHPDTDSFCGSLADAYIDTAKQSGAEVRELQLGKLSFDPILWQGYNKIQALEPDLKKAQELILWSTHMVFVYPNWWGAMPALMKGFFDRVFLPGFAFKYRDKSLPEKLLSGRTAHLMVTMDTPPWYYRWVFQRPGHNQMKRTILEFCGVKVVKISEFAPIMSSNQQQREKWLAKAKQLGSSA
ncbi:MAG: NAD(P)H-dependent oxidoreductase [Gammaproteobacteria bacterium]|nr:NAD(P)H-dependent oxidoreductase [Gammaproteobacteria bacterium]MDH5729230.1 NAD(P)H-dependent oxidoreductase [Gammaproteobacteria bacterium]